MVASVTKLWRDDDQIACVEINEFQRVRLQVEARGRKHKVRLSLEYRPKGNMTWMSANYLHLDHQALARLTRELARAAEIMKLSASE